jgi:hypothetical protein
VPLWLCGVLLASFGEISESASADVLSVALAPEVRCVKPSTLLQVLSARLAPISVARTASASDRFKLSLQAYGSHGVALELREYDEVLVRRELEIAPDECSALAYTLALIVETWLLAPRSGAGTAPQSSAATDTPPAAPSPRTPARVRAAPPSVKRAAAYRWMIEAGVGTSVPLESGPSPVIAGRVGVAFARDPWLFVLYGNVETARSLDAAADISLQHTSLELAVGASVIRAAKLDVALLLGTGVEAVSAHVVSYTKSDVAALFSPVSALAVRGAFQPSARVGLFVSMELAVSWRQVRFASENEPIAETPRARPRFVLGGAWHVF